MGEIALYQFQGDIGVESASPFCVKVHRALGYKGLDYAVRNVGTPAELKRVNPGVSKVPVLRYDGELVADSSRILELLDQRHPDPPLQPEGDHARALSCLLEDWADESLYWYAVYMRWAIDTNFVPFARRIFGKVPAPLRWMLPRLARRQSLQQLHGQGIGRLPVDRVLEGLRGHLQLLQTLLAGSPFLTGELIATADLAVFGPLRALAVESMPETAPLVRGNDTLVDWLRRVDRVTRSPHTVSFE